MNTILSRTLGKALSILSLADQRRFDSGHQLASFMRKPWLPAATMSSPATGHVRVGFEGHLPGQIVQVRCVGTSVYNSEEQPVGATQLLFRLSESFTSANKGKPVAINYSVIVNARKQFSRVLRVTL